MCKSAALRIKSTPTPTFAVLPRNNVPCVAPPHAARLGVVVGCFRLVTPLAHRREIAVLIRAAALECGYVLDLPIIGRADRARADVALAVGRREDPRPALGRHAAAPMMVEWVAHSTKSSAVSVKEPASVNHPFGVSTVVHPLSAVIVSSSNAMPYPCV